MAEALPTRSDTLRSQLPLLRSSEKYQAHPTRTAPQRGRLGMTYKKLPTSRRRPHSRRALAIISPASTSRSASRRAFEHVRER
jgi:hypothetical protein